MPGQSFLIYALFVVLGAGSRKADDRGTPIDCDTIPAGAQTVSSKYLTDFTVCAS